MHVFRTGFIHYIQKCCRHLSPSSTVEQVGLVISWIRITRSVCLSPTCLLAEEREPPLAQDVQVDGRGFSHGEKDLLNVLNVQPLLRFPLPAAQHDVVDLLGTDPWPLQDTTLGDALDHLQREGNRVTAQLINQDESRFGLSETLNRKQNLRFVFFFIWELGGKFNLLWVSGVKTDHQQDKERKTCDHLWATMVRSTACKLRALFPFCSCQTADLIGA